MSECVRRGGQESTVEHKNQQVWMVILARGGGEGRGSRGEVDLASLYFRGTAASFL